jgi:hypothetical protein
VSSPCTSLPLQNGKVGVPHSGYRVETYAFDIKGSGSWLQIGVLARMIECRHTLAGQPLCVSEVCGYDREYGLQRLPER